MTRLVFEVPGVPISWKRASTAASGRRVTTRVQKDRKYLIATCAKVAMHKAGIRAPFEGPITMTVDSYRKRPITATPDWDNVGKIVSDALSGVVYVDDAQVCDARVRKFDSRDFGDLERMVVTVNAQTKPTEGAAT